MVDKAVAEEVGGLKRLVPTGTSVLIEGTLSETPEGTKQAVELKAEKVRRVRAPGSGLRIAGGRLVRECAAGVGVHAVCEPCSRAARPA